MILASAPLDHNSSCCRRRHHSRIAARHRSNRIKIPKPTLKHLVCRRCRCGGESLLDDDSTPNIPDSCLAFIYIHTCFMPAGARRAKASRFKVHFGRSLRRNLRRGFVTASPFFADHGIWRLWPVSWPATQRHTRRANRRHPHIVGVVSCAWFGKIPVVERENGDIALHRLCYIWMMRI